jgi:hypothetical protein
LMSRFISEHSLQWTSPRAMVTSRQVPPFDLFQYLTFVICAYSVLYFVMFFLQNRACESVMLENIYMLRLWLFISLVRSLKIFSFVFLFDISGSCDVWEILLAYILNSVNCAEAISNFTHFPNIPDIIKRETLRLMWRNVAHISPASYNVQVKRPSFHHWKF